MKEKLIQRKKRLKIKKLRSQTMAIKKINVVIQGISALLMHQFPMESPPKGHEKWSAEQQAKLCEYRDPESGKLFIPGIAIQRCLIAGAVYSKGKGRASLKKPVAACVLISPERVSLGVKKYEVDSRPVVISATRGRIIRHRPRLDEWKCSFEIQFDDELVSAEEMKIVVEDAGKRCGLLDFRPACAGPFGRFRVTEWK